MNIESEIFKGTKWNKETLIPYGFIKKESIYIYSKEFMEGFKADIIIDDKGVVTGKVYDLHAEEEYTNFRIENQMGEFVNRVREEYQNMLKEIRTSCFDKFYFLTEQANRITQKIMELYHDEPEFIFEKAPSAGIFRNAKNKKWYGLIMCIDKSKIDKESTKEVEILNVKLREEQVVNLLKRKGFYPSYHMNKKNWITIVLDETLSDEEIMEYIKESYQYIASPKEWIIPANPKFYDVIDCFNHQDTVLWKQSSAVQVGDKVYLYVGSPYSSLLYKCEAVEVDIPYEYKDENVSMKRVMKLKLLKKYNQEEYPFSKLNAYGVKAVRGPRSMPEKLRQEINKSS